MERSRYVTPQKSRIKTTKSYLRESRSGPYNEVDEETVTPSRKGRVTTSHEPNFDYNRDNKNRRAHVPEHQDYIYYKRSGSRAESGYLGKSKKKPNHDENHKHKIYKERSQEPKVDRGVKEAFEKPKKVHFEMRESKSTPLSVRVNAIKQKHGSKTSRYYTPSPYQQYRNNERYSGDTPDFEDSNSSNDEDSKYTKYSNVKSIDDPRLQTGQYRRNAISKLQHPVEFGDLNDLSESEPDLDFYDRPYRSHRPQTLGKYSLYTSVPDNQTINYKHIPSRIPRPASGMSGPQKSALKKSSSFDSREEFSISKASRPHNTSNNENLQKMFEDESIPPEYLSSSRKITSQAKNNKRYTPFTPGSPKMPAKNTPLMDDFESESSDENSTDEFEPVDLRNHPSRSRKGRPANNDNFYPIETSESDSDEAFEQIEVYVPTAVFKHAPRQIYDHQDYSMNTIHERPAKENKRTEWSKHNEGYLENHDRNYKQNQNGKIYRIPIVVKRPESRSNDHNRMRKMEKEQIKESRQRYEATSQRGEKQGEEIDDGLMQGRRHYLQSKSHRNTSAETTHSYNKMELDDMSIKILRKAEDSHRMFMSVWLPPRTSNGGSAKPKRSLLDTPEHLFMLRRVVKRA